MHQFGTICPRLAALGGMLALAACVAGPPTEPTVMALPKQGEDLAVFQGDDGACRDYAYQSIGGPAAAQASNNAAVGSAVVGTALGAAAGAALGSLSGQMGAGAAIGGATGLLAGSAVGANQAQAGAYGNQYSFDVHYTQCMVSKGYTVQNQPAAPAPVYAYPGYGYAPYPYPYYAPSVGIGIGGGYWGGYRGWGGWHHY